MEPWQKFPILACATPPAWVQAAWEHREVLLIDHAHCEKKAARMALQLIHAYPDRSPLVHSMAQLAREELLHLRQVIDLLEQRGWRLRNLSASRYAPGLHALTSSHEPRRCMDLLICGAFIEARSCERFALLAERFGSLDKDLARYYAFLVRAESRHYRDYLTLAGQLGDCTLRVQEFARHEAALVCAPTKHLRMHSGPLVG